MEHDRLAAVVGIHGPHRLGYELVILERFIRYPHFEPEEVSICGAGSSCTE
jgi:hypothetical protein